MRRTLRGALAIALVLLASGSAAAQNARETRVVRVRDAGPGRPGRLLRAALAAPHLLLRADSAHPALLPRDTVYGTTVIVVGGPAKVASVVRGSVIVVGGDLFLHPGAQVDGNAVAIGGGVYNSTLALVRGERVAFRDETFVAATAGGGAGEPLVLDYRVLVHRRYPPIVWPGFFGVRIPTYDRVNGLSLPVGPELSLDTMRIRLDPTVTYRSDLGAFDPAVTLDLGVGRRLRVAADVGRHTLTNDAWIVSDVVNSLSSLGTGTDRRNYYRADRARGTVHFLFETATATIEPYVGAQTERDWSVGPEVGATSYPWSFLDRAEADAMLRPNPPVLPGHISSALAGAHMDWSDQGVAASADAEVERPFSTVGAPFTQLTVDASIAFPTFGTQSFSLDMHSVTTGGRGPAPPQRYSYLGGPGTLPTFDLLQFGGDELLYFDSRYVIPLSRPVIPLLGAPTITLRHAMGAAGVGKLPKIEQNLELRVALSFVRVGLVVDPASHATVFSTGVSFAR